MTDPDLREYAVAFETQKYPQGKSWYVNAISFSQAISMALIKAMHEMPVNGLHKMEPGDELRVRVMRTFTPPGEEVIA
jgi:hypothetical protein